MNGRIFARLAALAACVGIGTATVFGTAAAAPSATDTAIDHLTATAGKDAAAKNAVSKLAKSAHLLTAAKLDHIAGAFQPFWFSSPTFGCPGNPVTMTVSSGVAGSNGVDNGLHGGYGTLRFQATTATPGYATSSGLNVAWLNTGNGRSGVAPLNDMTQYRLPGLSKTVTTGPGTVVAAIWGTIGYPGGTCVIAPTVGAFTVYNAPAPNFNAPIPDPATPASPAPKAPSQAVPGGIPSGPHSAR
ncbi:hypothetical protein [Nocardia macrotermitis]|uniref:Uncharacterized protein n=1 Tax=Nocardia macrotermitis TaxID=2585198 RepID=A0A7K0D3S1_9NOCA|nr:hypothetical protein [Nocardia macrotermitis]MQY19952.1 hypothetical protein [Nocardia macrotermitis]